MCQRVTLEATNLYTCQNKSWDHYMSMIPTVIGCKTYEYLRQNHKWTLKLKPKMDKDQQDHTAQGN